MIRNLSAIVWIYILCCTTVIAQPNGFRYQRKLSPVRDGAWYSINLPSDIFSKLNREHSDLRLYHIAKDTTEVPYLFNVEDDEVESVRIALKSFNKSSRDGKLFITFEVPQGQAVNHAEFLFSDDNFDETITLEASDDGTKWFAIVSNQRIVALKNDNVDFRSSTINFPESKFRYLRAIISNSKLNFESATFRKNIIKKGRHLSIYKKINYNEDKAAKQTIVNIALDTLQPITGASIDIAFDQDYYRYYSFEYLSDSAKSPKGWSYLYTPVSSGYLTSLNQNEINFGGVTAKKLRLIIFNADNLPLKVEDVRLTRPAFSVLAKLSEGNDYYLFYGNDHAQAPSYDIVHFTNKIPDSLTTVNAGEELVIGSKAATASPLIQNQMWLWIIMGAVILLLGFFTLKMMKNKG